MNYKKILKFVLMGLFIMVQVYLFFIDDYDVRDDTRYINESPLPLDEKNKDIRQEFHTPGPLSRIDIMLANYKNKPKSGVLRLSVFNGTQCLFFKNYPANTTEDNRFYSFKITSKNKPPVPPGHYVLKLDYFPKNNNEKLAAWTSTKNLYPYGHLYVNNKLHEGGLTFRVYFHSTIWGQRNRWLNSIPRFPFRGPALSVGFLLLLFMVNFLFYYYLNKLMDESRI